MTTCGICTMFKVALIQLFISNFRIRHRILTNVSTNIPEMTQLYVAVKANKFFESSKYLEKHVTGKYTNDFLLEVAKY